jgi:hypothetical protein
MRHSVKINRQIRFIAVLIALLSMMSMQFAMAARVCPVSVNDPACELIIMSAINGGQTPSMTDCSQMEIAQPSLCGAYLQVNSQSLENPALPLIQPFAFANLLPIFQQTATAYHPAATQSPTPWLRRPPAASLAIQNCSFQI